MKTETLSIKWHETPVAGANVHLSDGVLGYWATVPAEWTEAQVREAFLATADYDETPRIEVTPREGNEAAACFAKCVEADDEATLADETADRETRIEAAARLCRAADEEQAVEGDSELTWESSAEQAGTIETMTQACGGTKPTRDDWKAFGNAY